MFMWPSGNFPACPWGKTALTIPVETIWIHYTQKLARNVGVNRKVCARGSLGADPDSGGSKYSKLSKKKKKCPLEYSFEYFIVPLDKLNNDQFCYHDKKKS
jgi:hypothetical protein